MPSWKTEPVRSRRICSRRCCQEVGADRAGLAEADVEQLLEALQPGAARDVDAALPVRPVVLEPRSGQEAGPGSEVEVGSADRDRRARAPLSELGMGGLGVARLREQGIDLREGVVDGGAQVGDQAFISIIHGLFLRRWGFRSRRPASDARASR